MRLNLFSKPADPARQALINSRVDVPSDNRVGARMGRLMCAMTLSFVAIVFLLSGVITRAEYFNRDQNDPAAWPGCETIPSNETFFSQCRDHLISEATACAFSGLAMMIIGCIVLSMDALCRYAESLHVDKQREQRLTAVEEKINNYGTGL